MRRSAEVGATARRARPVNLVAFSRFSGDLTGMIFAVFTICITVVEAALGLAIVILLFRVRRTVTADHLDLLKG